MQRRESQMYNVNNNQAVAKGNMELARLEAETAIRNKKQAISLKRLATSIEAVSERISSAMVMQNVATQLGRAIPMIRSVITGMDKLTMGQSMENFQGIFEELEIGRAHV